VVTKKPKNASQLSEPKKKKIPQVYADSEGVWDGIGKYKFRSEDGVLYVRWCVENG